MKLLSFLLTKTKPTNDDFKYDGYYALQAGEVIADFCPAMVKSRNRECRSIKSANRSELNSIKKLYKKIQRQKMSAQH